MTHKEGRSEQSTRKNHRVGLSTIDSVARGLDLPSEVRETAVCLYEEALIEYQHFGGKRIKPVACACLYLACKLEGTWSSADAIAERCDGVQGKILLRREKTLASDLGLDLNTIIDPRQRVIEFLDKLDASDEVRERALWIVKEVRGTHLSIGKNPRAVAGAAVFTARIEENERMTQGAIAEIADVSKTTIRKHHQAQREYLQL